MKEKIRRDAHWDIDHIFKELLPAQGLPERPEQTALSHRILDVMLNGGIALCDAGTGIGKTYAYLTAGIVFRRVRFVEGKPSKPLLISTSSIFGYCLTTLHVPTMAANAVVGLTNNPILIALLLNLILLVLGCIMDMAPIILIATPILLPIATSIGIDPIQFGIMIVLNCGIGLLTPPVGAVLFIGSAVGKVKMEKVVKATLPFYLCMIAVLLLLTFIPEITMLLPNLFY